LVAALKKYAACQTDSDDKEYVHNGDEEVCTSNTEEVDDEFDPVLRFGLRLLILQLY